MTNKTISFNTGRTYTEHGQRIAAMQLGNDVLMVDYDRCIEYLILDCPLDQFSIMYLYDKNLRCNYPKMQHKNLAILSRLARLVN